MFSIGVYPRLSSPDERDGLVFLALCSVRGLLNRIHNAVYASGSQAPLQPESTPCYTENDSSTGSPSLSTICSLERVLNELARQLEVWYHSLPDSIKPDLSHNVPTDAHEASLRLRYWSAKHIISRPCLVYVLSVSKADEVPTYVYKYSEMCIQSCRNYIETALQVLNKRTPYVWAICQACLATSFVLATSSESLILKHLVPDIEGIISRLIVAMQRWASPDSSIESIVCILQSIHQKQRLAKLKRQHSSTSMG